MEEKNQKKKKKSPLLITQRWTDLKSEYLHKRKIVLKSVTSIGETESICLFSIVQRHLLE